MKNSQKGFVIPLILLALVVIGAGIYLYTRSSKLATTPSNDAAQKVARDSGFFLEAKPISVTKDGVQVFYSVATKYNTRGSNGIILSISCPIGINATSEGIDACKNKLSPGVVTEIYFRNETDKPQNVIATAQLISGKDGVSVSAENFAEITIDPTCKNGATNYPRCNADLSSNIQAVAPKTKAFLDQMQRDLGIKLNYWNSTVFFMVPIESFNIVGSKELHGYAWDVEDVSESKYIYSKLSSDSWNASQRSMGYKNNSVFCTEQELHWSCGDIDEVTPYTIRIMPLDISNIDTQNRSFMLQIQGKQLKVVLMYDDRMLRKGTADVHPSLNDFVTAINDMKSRGANDPVMVKGNFSGNVFEAIELNWY